MVAQILRDLVEHANQTIVDTGQFPKAWWPRYQCAIAEASNIYDANTWPKQLFASLHYASTHLGLRYRVWKSAAAAHHKDTESLLSLVQLETDLYFWRSVCGLPSWKLDQTSGKGDNELIDLCFGCSSPLGQDSSQVLWKNEYEECLRKMHASKSSATEWRKWFCVALHFATFYLDLYQQRNVELVPGVESNEETKEIDNIIRTLSHHISNKHVLGVIRLWLCSANVERDTSGLPDIGIIRSRSEKMVSVRTSSELFLQMCLES